MVLIDTSDLLSTTSLNPLEGMKDDPLVASFIVSEIMSLVDLLFEGRDTSGPIAKSNLRNLLLLTAGCCCRGPPRHSSTGHTTVWNTAYAPASTVYAQ